MGEAIEALNAETRSMLEAYAAGVNAFLAATERFPIEYRILVESAYRRAAAELHPCCWRSGNASFQRWARVGGHRRARRRGRRKVLRRRS